MTSLHLSRKTTTVLVRVFLAFDYLFYFFETSLRVVIVIVELGFVGRLVSVWKWVSCSFYSSSSWNKRVLLLLLVGLFCCAWFKVSTRSNDKQQQWQWGKVTVIKYIWSLALTLWLSTWWGTTKQTNCNNNN